MRTDRGPSRHDRGVRALGLLTIACSLAALDGCARRSEQATPRARRLTSTADDQRTGWYPNQPELDPVIVGGPGFGRLWATALPLAAGEQVFAQPLVKGNTVFVATEGNNLYAIDAQAGAVLAARALGTPARAADLGCADLAPGIGITGTPVIDDATNTAYFFSKRYLTAQSTTDPHDVGWFMHGVDVDTLVERPGFPVPIGGQASNDPSTSFDPYLQHQRTALLLMNGVVYAGFGSHCDGGLWRGWVIGVGIDGHIKSLFATMVGADFGGGIWGSGGGLVSDGPGRIFFTTGNGSDASEAPQATPGLQLSESAVRLQVQADGTMVPVDFFTPANRSTLEKIDGDYGAGGPVALPSEAFGTPAYPNLLVTGGKSGTVYVLDRNHLGGYKQGPGSGDAVVAVIDAGTGLWNRAAVWPGDGGYIYLVPGAAGMQAHKYGVTSAGLPTFTRTGVTQATFGFSSGAPIVTSDGTTSGTAVVWVVNSTGSYGIGTLQAYAAVPTPAGELAKLYEDTFGPAVKFAPPGVGAGRVYVGSADGHLVAYGSPVNTAVKVTATQFGVVTVGSSKTVDLVITAQQAVTVTGLSTSAEAFSVGGPSTPLPASLAAGDTLTIPVTFTPSASALFAASLTVDTSAGPVAGSLRGTGQPTGPSLQASSKIANFGGLAVGTTKSINVTLSNLGAQTLTWTGSTPPAAPFSLSGLPAAGETLAAGASVTITATFAPVTKGTFDGSFSVESDGGSATVLMSGSAGDPQSLVITPLALSFDTEVGVPRNLGFTLTNAGGAPLTITKSKPPVMGTFSASPPLDEGSVIPPGQSVFEVVTFAPAAIGTYADEWIITGNDGSGVKTVSFTGVAHAPGDGLAATYFDTPDLTGNTVARIDPQIDFDWGGEAPAAGIGPNDFSAMWTGQVLPNTTEVYTFYAEADDGVRLWINGSLVIDEWVSHASREDMASVALVAGQAIDVRMDYWQGWGGAVARLSWSSPSLLKQIIPQVQLFSSGGAAAGGGGAPGTGGSPETGGASGTGTGGAAGAGTGGTGGGGPATGNGLQATYFDLQDLTGNTVTRIDPTVNFDWSGTSPDPQIPTVAFSARWTGKVKAPTSETYTISASADDGVRVWVAGSLVIDGWQDQALTTFQSPPLALVAGQLYDIVVEYYQGWGGAIVSLSWASPSIPAQVIPQEALSP